MAFFYINYGFVWYLAYFLDHHQKSKGVWNIIHKTPIEIISIML
jgi:hypothetical protein